MKREIGAKHIITICICVIMVAVSQSLSLKAAIGVCACWDSVSMNVYELCGLKVGTFGILLNTSLVIVQMLLQKKEFKLFKLLQVPLCILSGVVTNLMYYHIFTFEVNSYAMRVVLLVLSFVGLAIFVGCMTLIDVITMPLEAVCYVLENRFGIAFSKTRMAADVIFILLSIVTSLVFGLSFKVREGTIIGFILLGPLMGYMMKVERRIPFIHNMIQE